MTDPEAKRRRKLTIAARELLFLAGRCPELFERVLPISRRDRETLREIAFADDEEDENAAN